jgi:predicted permease
MGMQSWVRSVWRNLLHKRSVEAGLSDEVRGYVEMLTDEKVAAGVPPEQARREALIEMGGEAQVKQAVRDGRAGSGLETLWQDARFGWRMLRRSPGFTIVAVVSLGLGIGATTAIFSAVYSLLLRPLDYRDANSLVWVSNSWPRFHMDTVFSPDFVAARAQAKSFAELAAFTERDQNLTEAGEPARTSYASVTANFFPMLGVRPQLGRGFTAEEDKPGGPNVVMISDRLWRRNFNADPRVIGAGITLNGERHWVIGVLPAHFRFPDVQLEPDVYGTLGLTAVDTVSIDKPMMNLEVIGRLRAGVSAESAREEMRAFYANRALSYPAAMAHLAEGQQTTVASLQRHLTGDDRKPLLILLAAVGLVLLIACANVANLQLARSGARRHETSVRGALGASRVRLIRQFLTESMLLSMMAAGLGLAIAFAITVLVQHVTIPDAPQINLYERAVQLVRLPFGKLSAAISVDGWVLAFTAGIAVLTTLLFGLAPAIRGTRPDLASALQGATLRITSGREQRGLRHALLVAEVGLAIVLLSCAGLLIRSFVHVVGSDPGFDPRDTLTGVTLLSGSRYETGAGMTSFVNGVLPLLSGLPGVKAAAVSSLLPMQPYDERTAIAMDGAPAPPMGFRPSVPVISVTPDYFHAVGTALLKGRALSTGDQDKSMPVAVVNAAFTRKYFHDGEGLGRRFNLYFRGDDHTVVTIVGICADTRHNGLEQPAQAEVYLPMAQYPQPALNLIVRTDARAGSVTGLMAAGDADLLAKSMREAVLSVDREQPLFDVQTMEQRVSSAVAQRRLTMSLLGLFAGLAVVLSAVGVYGVFSYSVTQRVHEIAIRLALGAARTAVLRLVLVEAVRLIVAGSLLGLLAAFFLGRLLTGWLVGVSPHDGVSLGVACGLMMAVGLGASLVPAAHAARTDLNAVLHSE